MCFLGLESDDNSAEKGDDAKAKEKNVTWNLHDHSRKHHGHKMHGHGHWKHGGRGRGRRMMAAMWGPWRHGPYQVDPWAMWQAGMGGGECPVVEGQCSKKCWKKWSKKCGKEDKMEGACGNRCFKKWMKRCGKERDSSEEGHPEGVWGKKFCKKWNKKCRKERESSKERKSSSDSESDGKKAAKKQQKKVQYQLHVLLLEKYQLMLLSNVENQTKM